jgi:hypothetical protein
MLLRESVQLLVSSAARGADLVAIEAAHAMGISNLIVLPFDKERFRRTSVTDGDGAEIWGTRFDALIRDAEDRRHLIVAAPQSSISPYRAASLEIVREARKQAAERRARFLAIAVWDGQSRGTEDHTAAFLDLARKDEATILPFINTLAG